MNVSRREPPEVNDIRRIVGCPLGTPQIVVEDASGSPREVFRLADGKPSGRRVPAFAKQKSGSILLELIYLEIATPDHAG